MIYLGCRQSEKMIAGFSPLRTNYCSIANNKEDTNLLIGILTGQDRLKRHFSLMSIEEDAKCTEWAEVRPSKTMPGRGKNGVRHLWHTK